MKKENLIPSSIGIAVILTFLVLFTFMLYGQKERLFLSLIIGIVVVSALTFVHIKILKYPAKRALVSVILGMVMSFLFFMAYLFVLGGPSYFENQPASYDYRISVQDLSNYSGSLVTDIIVPIPMRNGEQIFTDEEMQDKSFGNWTSILVVTRQGKMLAFQTRDENLTNIEARFRKNLNYSFDIKDIMQDSLLYPVISEVAANYTIWIYSDKNVQNYTTYIYIDKNIQPAKGETNIITFNLELTVRGGMIHGRAITYKVDVAESIPESIKGPIPVKAQIGIIGDTGWGPLRPH